MKNVVLLTIDTLRQDALGCYQEESKLTPFLDSLQEKAIRFTNMQAVGPYTQASFPGILTSSYYLDWGRQKKCPRERTLVSEVLQEQGITTAGIHSNPYISSFFGWRRGWDYFYDSMEEKVSDEVPYVTGEVINQKVARWLEGHTAGEDYSPFFLWAHYMDVHEPYVPDGAALRQIDPSLALSRQEMITLFREVLLPRKTEDTEKVALLRTLYSAKIRQVDEYTRRLIQILQERGVWEETSLIITSDHGDEFGEHGGLSHDGKFPRELITVPCLIIEPHRTRGEVSPTLVSNLDLPPTICHLFDLTPRKAFQGHSLLPLDDYPDKPCFGEAMDKVGAHEKQDNTPTYYCQKGSLKVIYREKGEAWELYDLAEDPGEQRNIVQTSAEAEAMKTLLQPRIRRWEQRQDK